VQQTLAQVMLDREADKPVGGPDKRVEMDDAYLGGKPRGAKRGRGAGAKTPIVVALETSAESHPLRLKLTAVKGFPKAEIRKLSARALVPGTRVISDRLDCFAAVTQAGCQHEPILTGSAAAAVQDHRQHQERDPGQLSCHPAQACSKIPGAVRVPLQATMPPGRHDRALRLGRATRPADALSTPPIS
jgi:hypothetical protein